MTTTTFEVGDTTIPISTPHADADETVVRLMHTHYFVAGVLETLHERADEDGVVEGWSQPAVDTLDEAYLTGKWLLDEIEDGGIPDDVGELDEELLREIRRTIVPVAASLGVEIGLEATAEQPSLFDSLPFVGWSQ
ncbi:hypothetical protein [Halorientalis regularis]|uniref:Uncharacterized protein n=1 Tax=Halorientalis regularis TaxID=660518 RepID=A0A1G7UDN9_9EURY|nr:hypothetical protein [Halorientalis regularis]SDG45179.1 hypothetical protein SAMN05216218_1493 [Halorientalis regularis]